MRVYRVAPLAAFMLLAGCMQSQLSLSVRSPQGTNMDRPMYMLVRQVDPKQYGNEAYSEVAAKVGASDNSVLHSAVIYPGTVQRFQVKTPKDAQVAVSFLFTAPDGNWQTLIPPQTSSLDIELTISRILSDSVPPALPTEMPEVPKLEAPKAPEVPKLEAPKAPEIPKLAMPKL
jgi:hypothetical protein